MTPQNGAALLHSLRVDGRIEPLGHPCTPPRLSWGVASDPPLADGARFRVEVAEDEAALGDGRPIWTTTSSRPWVVYDGPELTSRTRRVWRVGAETDGGTVTSEPASWETGLDSATEWTASWIHGLAEPYRTESWDPCPYLRTTFDVDRPDDGPARLYATALGLYRVWLNGVELTASELYRPGWTDYRTRVLHQTYDASAALRPGRNVLAVVLAKGWYAGRLGLLRKPGFYGDRPAFLAQLEVGGEVVAATNDRWRTGHGAILGSDLLRGESQDLRREPAAWRELGFDDGSWARVDAVADPPATVVPQPHDSITAYREHAGELVHEHARGPLVFDFGQNLVGWTRLTSPLSDGVEVIVRHGEVLTPEQLVYRDNLRGAFQEDRYVPAGDGPATVETSFTAHGFRYAEVWGLPSTTEYGMVRRLPETSITAVSVTGLPTLAGTFECSDDRVTRLARNVEWSVRDNVLEAATDCPQRDERHGWLGDAGVIMPTAAYHFDVSAFLAKFTQDAADAQGPDGEIPNYVPAVPPSGLGPGAPGWADGYIRLVHLLVERYGDLTTARRLYPSMRAFADHVDRHNPDGLRVNQVGANFGDWLSLPEGDDHEPFHTGYEYTGAYSTTPLAIVGTAHTYRSFVQLAEIAAWLGDDAEAGRLRARAAQVRDAYVRAFVLADGEIAGATQTAYAQAVGFGLLEGADATDAADRLRAAIERVGYVTTGIHGTQHVLGALADHGHGAFANRLLLRDEMPSWLYMVANGATTIWEKWNAIAPDGRLATAEMNSFNHYALGAVGRYLFERIGGIDATTTTWTGEVSVRANYTRDLDHVACRYDSPVGAIASAWRWDGDVVEHEIEVPGATTAVVTAPAGATIRGADGAAPTVRLGAGHHTVTIAGLGS